MINREDFDEFDRWFTAQVLVNPKARYGEEFLNYFPEVANLSYNPSSADGISTWHIYTEQDKDTARDLCLRFVLDHDNERSE